MDWKTIAAERLSWHACAAVFSSIESMWGQSWVNQYELFVVAQTFPMITVHVL